jgi:hypothetical protein
LSEVFPDHPDGLEDAVVVPGHRGIAPFRLGADFGTAAVERDEIHRNSE